MAIWDSDYEIFVKIFKEDWRSLRAFSAQFGIFWVGHFSFVNKYHLDI